MLMTDSDMLRLLRSIDRKLDGMRDDMREFKTRILTIPDVMSLLVRECDLEGGIRPWADARNLHPSIIDKFLAGQRGPAPQLLAALNLESITVYRVKHGLPQD